MLVKRSDTWYTWLSWGGTVLLLTAQFVFFEWLTIPHLFAHGFFLFFGCFLAKVVAAGLCAMPILFMRSKWLVVTLLVLLNMWMVANLVYFQANTLYLSGDAIAMAYNLKGFENAIFAYIRWQTLLIPIGLLCWLPILLLRPTVPIINKGLILTGALALLSPLAALSRWYGFHEHETDYGCIPVNYFNPFILPAEQVPEDWQMEIKPQRYVEQHSIAAYAINMCFESVSLHQIRSNHRRNGLNEADSKRISGLLRPIVPPKKPEGHLVLIVVESLESWTLEMHDTTGADVTPCMNRYLRTHPVLFADKLISQVRHGVSGDGHMIINTGLLPLFDGAACMLYGTNTYPNLAHFYSSAIVINSCPCVWNSAITLPHYDYTSIVEPTGSGFWQDDEVICHLLEQVNIAEEPTCFMALTYSSHSPFTLVAPTLPFTDELSLQENRYLQCIHFADSCIGTFLDWADTTSCMRNSTIVITGDHIVFRDRNHFCPLIISTPALQETQIVTDTCYQMDIFPTLLHCIGQQDYFWQGFGLDLIGCPSCIRSCESSEALYLSDKLIQTDFFRDYSHK